MIIFTLRRLLLLLITLFFLTLCRFTVVAYLTPCPTAGRFPVECVAVLV